MDSTAIVLLVCTYGIGNTSGVNLHFIQFS